MVLGLVVVARVRCILSYVLEGRRLKICVLHLPIRTYAHGQTDTYVVHIYIYIYIFIYTDIYV